MLENGEEMVGYFEKSGLADAENEQKAHKIPQ